MKKVVISGSVKNQDQIQKWVKYWEEKDGYMVLDYPKLIPAEDFEEKYPDVYKDFFKNILEADVLFVANYEKNGIKGYIGPGVFAEINFVLVQKIIHNKDIKIVLAHNPSKEIQPYEEISLWIKLGWINILEDN